MSVLLYSLIHLVRPVSPPCHPLARFLSSPLADPVRACTATAPYEDSTKSATPTAGPSSYTLSAHAAPFVPASHLISYQRQPTLHCSMSYTLPPRPRHVTPLGPSPYHSLPPPVSYERAHGLTLADRRARKRFWYALFWGVLLYLAISAVVTVGMQNQEELQREARHAWKGIQRWIKDLENRWDSERLDDRWGPRVEVSGR